MFGIDVGCVFEMFGIYVGCCLRCVAYMLDVLPGFCVVGFWVVVGVLGVVLFVLWGIVFCGFNWTFRLCCVCRRQVVVRASVARYAAQSTGAKRTSPSAPVNRYDAPPTGAKRTSPSAPVNRYAAQPTGATSSKPQIL